jgi:hypothetical protein
MTDQIKDIRSLMDDINDIINKTSLNESYVFGHGQEENKNIQQPSLEKKISTDENENIVDNKPNIQQPDIKNKIGKIRSISIYLLADINPSNDPEAYKLVKGIWDSCDKFLLKGTEELKPKQENNNI